MLPPLIPRIILSDRNYLLLLIPQEDTLFKIRWFTKFHPVAVVGDSLNIFKKNVILILLMG